ncbi:hypothetical protein L6164_004682 [Bauhinia variegata]|uniref:Uncharacterized protein n=1 Tax=Bauhinia variegata TaxID=167791 RepID=A0ACB9PP48_BAUVA|nr:hypothetical protein L6164_004682 [Bauhinia variegata]
MQSLSLYNGTLSQSGLFSSLSCIRAGNAGMVTTAELDGWLKEAEKQQKEIERWSRRNVSSMRMDAKIDV